MKIIIINVLNANVKRFTFSVVNEILIFFSSYTDLIVSLI